MIIRNLREVDETSELEQCALIGSEDSQGSKGRCGGVRTYPFRKHSAEQEDRCGVLYQQLVAGPLRRDGGSFGVSADVARAFYEYRCIYIIQSIYIYI